MRAGPAYERLGAQDASFLHFEQSHTPMHVAAVAIFEGGPLATADGGLDAGRIAKHVESRLELLPRYRSRIAFTPLERAAVWVDDERFDLGFHLRRAALPRPGSERELQELVARILSQPLDRSRPLWELWIVEGLEGGRFALVSKIHHCMVDGVSGANLLTLLFSTSPDEQPSPAPPWSPRRPPSAVDLGIGELTRGAKTGGELVRAVGDALRDPRGAWRRLGETGSAVAQAVEAGLRLPARTSLNGPIGPHRRVDWLSLDLEAVRAAKRRLGGTVNDVVLAVVCGALRRFERARGPWPARFDYKIVVPVNLRTEGAPVRAANHVSALFLSLPVAERDPLRRFARIRTETERLKGSRAAEGIELLTRFADRVGSPWMTLMGARLASRLHPYNLIVTNVPGPPMPLYVLGAPLREIYPQLPLFEQQGLGVAVLSYCGKVGFGLIADRDLVPDLPRLREGLAESFAELESAVKRPRRRSLPGA